MPASVPAISNAGAHSMHTALVDQILDRAVKYIVNNYDQNIGGDPNISLVHVSPDYGNLLRNRHFINSDNYLASLVLSTYDPGNVTLTEMATIINNSRQYCLDRAHVTNADNQYMTLTENVSAFSGSRDVELYVPGIANGTIMTTLNDGGPLRPQEYADIAFLQAIYNYTWGNKSHASIDFQYGVDCWNSSNNAGFEDKPFTDNNSGSKGRYQTYKLALYIYASKLLDKEDQGYYQKANSTLLNLTWGNGGFATEYNSSLQQISNGTNTETTCLAILALDLQKSEPNPEPIPEFGTIVIPIISIVAISTVWNRHRNLYRKRSEKGV
jgi:hypothetical protein